MIEGRSVREKKTKNDISLSCNSLLSRDANRDGLLVPIKCNHNTKLHRICNERNCRRCSNFAIFNPEKFLNAQDAVTSCQDEAAEDVFFKSLKLKSPLVAFLKFAEKDETFFCSFFGTPNHASCKSR